MYYIYLKWKKKTEKSMYHMCKNCVRRLYVVSYAYFSNIYIRILMNILIFQAANYY